jgi:hypothetical protein
LFRISCFEFRILGKPSSAVNKTARSEGRTRPWMSARKSSRIAGVPGGQRTPSMFRERLEAYRFEGRPQAASLRPGAIPCEASHRPPCRGERSVVRRDAAQASPVQTHHVVATPWFVERPTPF